MISTDLTTLKSERWPASGIAWDFVGYDGSGQLRIVGGRTLYETADNTAADRVRLARLVYATPGRLRQINRYVPADTRLEVVR